MKKYNIIHALIFCMLALASCKDDFLQEKRDLTGINEQVFEQPVTAQAYVDYIYFMFQPDNNGQPFIHDQTGVRGQFTDMYTKTTEEMAGETDINRLWGAIAINQNHALQYFGERVQGTGTQNNTWTRLRQINLFLDEIDKHGLTPEITNPLKGQVLFWRAYQYFELLKLYGGVPIVLTAQSPYLGEGNNPNALPRNSSSETLEQIIKDLDDAQTMLPDAWPSNGWGRITKGAAAAYKGRVLLTWASPLFNRTDDMQRWERAYVANMEAKEMLEVAGKSLFKQGNLATGQAWENMWFVQSNNPEAVIVYNYNNLTSDLTRRNNGHEQAARPREILGGGSISPTKQMVDAFPMKDGKMMGDPTSAYTYDEKKFYKNRDPRFYKTFAYNGSLWPYSGNPNYRTWTYSWFSTAARANTLEPDRYTETNPNSSGIYLRKATNPAANNANGNFALSTTDYMEMRFAEVVLNLAEAAIGTNRLAEGLEGIKQIRERAGIENQDGAYGLSGAMASRDQMFAAVLHERQIEFAYEGKRFWDLRRWMLFDNYPGVNTLARLGMKPLNGTRRTGYWIYVKKADGTPHVGTTNPLVVTGTGAPVIDRQPAAYPAGISNQDEYLDYLYDNHFVVKERDNLDPTNNNWKFTWYDEYYFFGIHQNILTSSPHLQQTKGWPALTGNTDFDPLR
ncbi:RagB/SusD family nutrient uptake outer membrane protein [Pontibacter qinzhouensis]|uniref:RagB/SusD family nutrient uptake outer membrane protein n=1 Tax=Pontibacter qinzhouensis TaxID=2603253 RepID=A0A5C8KB66_9BACT|nr:RagB/SusD family nutrient uptake outer membrane protein [Pontibacter qinzhouensis]TXK50268.1 RagB/SusD family nutrient uptake outer membrane protein [Pontibacter qinzhouensis]